MYETKPYNAESRKNINLPTSMYYLYKLYDTDPTNKDSKMNSLQLEDNQHNLLVRMEHLKQQIYIMKKCMEKSQYNSVMNKCVSDIVIFFHPTNVPISILVAVEILSHVKRVHKQCLLHSSLKNKFQVPQQLQDNHSSLCHDRYEYDFVVTFILRDIETPMMNMNACMPYCIRGISTITKFIFNLTQQNGHTQLDQDDDAIRMTQVDKWIELADCVLTNLNVKNAYDELVAKSKERLTKNSWLVGNECSAADLLVLSAICSNGVHQLGKEYNNWIQACSLNSIKN